MTNAQHNKINGLLGITLVILIGIYYFQNTTTVQNNIATLPSGLTAQQATDIQFSIANKNFRLQKQASKQWVFVDPLPIKALNKRVIKLLDILSSPYSQSFLAANVNLQELGLKPAKARLTINNEIFEFGDTSPINAERYVLYKKHVYLINDLIYPLMDSRLQGLADMTLLDQGVDVLGVKTPFFESTKKTELRVWQGLTAIGVKKWTQQKSLGEIILTSQNKTFQFSIIQYQPLFILKPKQQNSLYIFANDMSKP